MLLKPHFIFSIALICSNVGVYPLPLPHAPASGLDRAAGHQLATAEFQDLQRRVTGAERKRLLQQLYDEAFFQKGGRAHLSWSEVDHLINAHPELELDRTTFAKGFNARDQYLQSLVAYSGGHILDSKYNPHRQPLPNSLEGPRTGPHIPGDKDHHGGGSSQPSGSGIQDADEFKVPDLPHHTRSSPHSGTHQSHDRGGDVGNQHRSAGSAIDQPPQTGGPGHPHSSAHVPNDGAGADHDRGHPQGPPHVHGNKGAQGSNNT